MFNNLVILMLLSSRDQVFILVGGGEGPGGGTGCKI